MVPAIRCGLSPRAQAVWQSRYRYRRIMEVRHTDTIALSLRPARDALPRIWLSLVPGALLVESCQTADAGRMGQRAPRSCEGCCQLHLVAVTHAMAQSQ